MDSIKISKSEFAPNNHKGGDKVPGIMLSLSDNKDTSRNNLNREQTVAAVSELYDRGHLDAFPKSYKFAKDPVHNNQVYCLHSFIPSRDATPDKDGCYGVVKFRGVCGTLEEADDRAETILREIDSTQVIKIGYVGAPFPLTTKSSYSESINDVDLQNKVEETVNRDIKAKQRQEKQEINEIKEREKKLHEDVRHDKEDDPLEIYTELQVKRANILASREQYKEALEKTLGILERTNVLIAKLNEDHPNFKNEYMARYEHALKEAGIPTMDNTLIKFMNPSITE